MGTTGAWTIYDEWNGVLADALFAVDASGLPVYIDVSEELLGSCASRIGLDPVDAVSSLAKAVAGTLHFERGVKAFSGHARRLATWRREHLSQTGQRTKRTSEAEPSPPPIVGVLVLSVVAAARMGEDQSMAANAYYPKLHQLLGVDGADARKVTGDFPVTEAFWRALNEYLEMLEGERGLPTAYALGHRYVGIPQSQALVRAHDRARLPVFFRLFGLVPRSEMIPDDVERLLDVWISSTPCPVSTNLRNLWRRGKARERIAGVVAVELALWDGALAASDSGIDGAGDLRLTAVVRQQFGGRSVELSFAARLPGSDNIPALEIASAAESPSIGVVPAPGSRVRPTPGSRLDASSLVSAVLEVADPSRDVAVSRRPRRVVPLRRDDLLAAAVEIDRVQLADDFSLLVQDDPKLLPVVLALLTRHGRHGRICRSSQQEGSEVLNGLPEGWVLIEDAQIYSVPQDVARLELQVLVPQTTAQMNFAGGLRMPGKVRKWSSLNPPEIRAAVIGAETMSIAIWDLGEERVLLEKWTDQVSAMVRPLHDLDLADGDYEVELEVNGEVISVSTLRLRSADTPDLISWETCARLNYELGDSARGAVSAIEGAKDGEVVVDGLAAYGSTQVSVSQVPIRAGQSWASRKSGDRVAVAPVVLGVADAQSCVVTGRHYTEYPTYMGGRTRGVIHGVCKHCGLTKTSPASPRWKRSRGDEPRPALRFDLPDIGETSTRARSASWDNCLDALIHVGGGSIESLDRIASQVEGSSLFTDQFLRTLEGLGHIDVRRDDSLLPAEWEANPPYAAETSSGAFVLAGVWSRALRTALAAAVRTEGGSLERSEVSDAPSGWFVTGLSTDRLSAATEQMADDVYVVPDAVTQMLDTLPPLSEVGLSLDETSIPSYSKASIFDLEQASWSPVPGVGVPGAYRLEHSFRSTTIWVSPEGAVSRTARRASIQLVKHLAAQAAGRPLLGYVETGQVLVVPMGADLPGIYGRVAMLCSGRPPQLSRSTRSLGYVGVPRTIADRLNSLLAN